MSGGGATGAMKDDGAMRTPAASPA
jgi:hypothetical protein